MKMDEKSNFQVVVMKEDKMLWCQEIQQIKIQYVKIAVLCRFCHLKA